jgi:Glycine/D-amino acid oxidases (deaminating)
LKVCVLGCGVIGLFTAYMLKSSGLDVVVVCRDLPGSSSKANGGIVTLSFTPAPWPGLLRLISALLGLEGPLAVSFRELLGFKGLRWVLDAYRARGGRVDVLKALASRSLYLYGELLPKLDVEYSRGVLALFTRREDAELHVKLHGGKLVEGGEVRDLGFNGFEAGVMAGDEIALDPVGLLKALRRLLEECKFIERIATGLKPLRDGVKIVLEDGVTVSFDKAVLTLGAWSSRMLEELHVRIPLKPARGLAYLVRTEKPPVGVPAILEDYGVVVSPIPRGFTRVSSFFELKGFTLEWGRGRLRWLENVISKHVPGLRGYKVENFQTGFRPCTPDMLPVVGELPDVKGVYIASGHCRLGVTLAPVTGELIASTILDVKPGFPENVLTSISPKRFI